MRIAITATSKALLTEYQLDAARELIQPGDIVHLGDCVNGDAQIHQLCLSIGGVRTIGHPPINGKNRAFCVYDEEWEPEAYLDRDHAMVDACDVLLAFPRSPREELRSGTWATVRYARKSGCHTTVIPPRR